MAPAEGLIQPRIGTIDRGESSYGTQGCLLWGSIDWGNSTGSQWLAAMAKNAGVRGDGSYCARKQKLIEAKHLRRQGDAYQAKSLPRSQATTSNRGLLLEEEDIQ